jgi:hypothetical protein
VRLTAVLWIAVVIFLASLVREHVGQVFIVFILAGAIYLAWSYSRGVTSRVPIYALPVIVTLSLLAAAVAQLLGAAGVVEVLNVAAIAFSLAALATTPRLWRLQVQDDLQRTKVVEAFQPADLLSWRWWLKLVDRVGAGRAALCYLGVLAVAVVIALATLGGVASDERGLAAIPALIVLPFAGLSAFWLYRAAIRLIPDA